MPFPARAATVAAMMLGFIGLVGVGTPGLAATPDKTAIDTPISPGVDYASLSEAVAAQDTETVDPDLLCMAAAIYFEAKGEPLSGQLAVADVILNRTKSGRYPTSVCGVVTQPGQFAFVRGGRIPDIADGHMYRTAIAVGRIAMTDAWDSPAPKAMFFHAKRVAPTWRKIKVASIGNHVFYR
jgi:N-acetylmuramoyl-L-alanine amidase